MNSDVGVTPAVYDPALQQDEVVCAQIPEEGAESVHSHGMHWGDLCQQVTGIPARHPGKMVTGRAWPPGVPGTSLRFRVSSGPRSTWEYVQDQRNAPEIPKRAIFLTMAADSREAGDSLDSCQVGGGDYRPVVRAGLADELQQGEEAASGDVGPPRTARRVQRNSGASQAFHHQRLIALHGAENI